jgi:hypothetical protein
VYITAAACYKPTLAVTASFDLQAGYAMERCTALSHCQSCDSIVKELKLYASKPANALQLLHNLFTQLP